MILLVLIHGTRHNNDMLMRIGTWFRAPETNILKNGVPGGRAAAEHTSFLRK